MLPKTPEVEGSFILLIPGNWFPCAEIFDILSMQAAGFEAGAEESAIISLLCVLYRVFGARVLFVTAVQDMMNYIRINNRVPSNAASVP